MELSKEILAKLESCLEDKRIIEICKDLGIIEDNDSKEDRVKEIREYISKDLLGDIRGQSAIIRFLKCINSYIENDELVRINDEGYFTNGFVDYNLVLPIKNDKNRKKTGVRVSSEVLGADKNRYILKKAEGLNGGVSGKKNAGDAKYNPTIAYAFYTYLGEECAEAIPGFEKHPYFYIFSKSFLKENQEIISLNDISFITKELVIDENNNITHQSILDTIDNYIKKLKIDPEMKISDKLKQQYATQETIKKIICSMDENLGNTSFIITKDEKGNIIDINLSPAYDLDISFELGEEMKNAIGNIDQLNRVTRDGKNDLKSLIKEFKNIPGYIERMQWILQKFQGEYTNKIFDIAYKSTKIDKFRDSKMIEKYNNFITKRVSLFKEAFKDEKDNILKKE